MRELATPSNSTYLGVYGPRPVLFCVPLFTVYLTNTCNLMSYIYSYKLDINGFEIYVLVSMILHLINT